MVIGGLIREEEIKTMSKIPILGDLPFIGELFRHRNNSHRKSEILVVITPRIVRPGVAQSTGAAGGGN
jgi:type II secretory pathway component GspD/PulD (secretin)